jgi:hypothetical protein
MKLTPEQLHKIKSHFKLSNQELVVLNLIFSGVDKAIVGWALAHADFV